MAKTDPFLALDKTMQFVLPDVVARVLGQQDILIGPTWVLAYFKDARAQKEWGPYTITVVANRQTGRVLPPAGGVPAIAPWVIFRVNNLVVGKDPTGKNISSSIWFWGNATGPTTVVSTALWYVKPLYRLLQNLSNRVGGTAASTP